MKKQLDASSEVLEIRSAVEAARILLDLVANSGVPDDETERALPRCTSAVLTLATSRMKALARAMGGSIDPAELVEHHNKTVGDGGVALTAWTDVRREQEAQRELRRVAHERRSRRRR